MDRADPETQRKLTELLARESDRQGLTYHHLRHRHLGDAHWVEVHLVFPEGVSLTEAHREATRIEQVLEASLEPVGHVTTHLESAADHDELHPYERVADPGQK
jgi:divalent metal cation (Fe/Co/Zn/Cd) transporter